MKSYAVIGLGRFGGRIAKRLHENGDYVIAIDNDEELVAQLADDVTKAVILDAKNKNELKKLGVPECDCVVVAVGDNLANSVLITMNVKSLGVDEIICKAHDETHKEILEKLGASKVIIPEYDIAEKTARLLSTPNVIDFIEFSDECGIIKITPPKTWIGRTIRELNIRNKHQVSLLSVTENGKVKVSVPAEYVIKEGETLTLIGEYKALEQLRKIK